ncbi:hypothetical protein K1T71_010438 [Dendrolimus kikuchii]|uniref:Uncharacterized protein n=1 Tax=Dendrolimus kikuchii TaxID=765133 RepID=A0ACC1CSN4_9NEOP|nr:hypothetical protein K1T71_010438 [Dendrolimus kikuchii]
MCNNFDLNTLNFIVKQLNIFSAEQSEAYKSASDKNVISSPLGIMTLLSFFEEGAGPQTKQQIDQYMGVEQSSGLFSDLSRRLAQEDPSYLTVANKIYVSNKYTLNNYFAGIAKTYESEVEPINFGDNEAAAATINRWADEKTRGNIKDPVRADSLDSDTVAALCNIIFFQGHWHVPFDKNDTVDKDFHIDNSNTVKKPTMHLKQSLFYTENQALGAKMVELPYKEYGFRMVIVLPDEIDGLPKVLAKATETGLLNDVFNLAPANTEVILDLPKFEVKNRLDLNDLLPKLGVSKMFEEGATGIVENDTVVVSQAFQKAFVKVDEEGATAGAFTGYIMVAISEPPQYPPSITFKVDHPFLYLILHQDKILFTGTTLGPWGPGAHHLYPDLSTRLIEVLRDQKAGLHLGQRISVAIQCGDAASIGHAPRRRRFGVIFLFIDLCYFVSIALSIK